MAEKREDLSTLEGIRAVFAARFEAASIGYHALGEQVLSDYWRTGRDRVKPASAMTFRNFLQTRQPDELADARAGEG